MPNKNMYASVLFFSMALMGMAQGTNPPPPVPPPPPGLPIDNDIIFLFVAALLFGAYKAYKISRTKKLLP